MTLDEIKYAASIFTIIVIVLVIVLTLVVMWLVSKDKNMKGIIENKDNYKNLKKKE